MKRTYCWLSQVTVSGNNFLVSKLPIGKTGQGIERSHHTGIRDAVTPFIRFSAAGFAFFQKLPKAPEVLFFCQPETLVQVFPGFCRVMPEPVSRDPECVGHTVLRISYGSFSNFVVR
nr:hypothetical protein [uncultured Methanoregula sp.]